MQKLVACFIFLLSISPSLFGQNTTDSTSALKVSFRNMSFFSNNEFNSKFAKGYTITGNWIKGGLQFSPSNNIEIEGGIYYHHFFGETLFNTYHPIYYRIKYTPYEKLSVTFGDIYKYTNHFLHEILFDYEKNFTNPVEEGFMIEYTGSKLLIEAWINWQKFIRINSPFREEFQAGITIHKQLAAINKHKVSFRFNGIAQHKGGEIDDSPLPVSSIFNNSIMLTHSIDNKKNTVVNEFTLGFIAMLADSKLPEIPWKKGHGFIIENRFMYKNFSAITSYWHGKNFYSPNGNIIYSAFQDNTEFSERDLLTFGIIWEKSIFNGTTISLKNEFNYNPVLNIPDLRSILYLKLDLSSPTTRR